MGAFLKMSAYSAVGSGQPQPADVGMPQVRNFRAHLCLFRCKSGMMHGGRVRLTCNNIRGPVRADALGAPQTKWRIGCRRAFVSSWFWPWFPQWPLAPRRKSRHRSRLSSRPRIPASTKNSARACLPRHGGPDAIPSRTGLTAGGTFPNISVVCRQGPVALRAPWALQAVDCPIRSAAGC